ncbi:zinc finger BED domain-containing protein 5-like isoform X2 [Myzus persicae]|uniref:zinc finger BED domain-containing protein 5-like isoform X2 n=1 Tax=Myzus persicae TaxID=13164 RepID=UPI000B931C90|nr:zinc finger BED domain-containing protein 5-like isoform X2 [Myzus persicae]
MEAQHVCLLLHCEVRWLSRDDIWCVKMAYLADIFNYLNSVNAGMQGKNENILTPTDKLLTIKKNISFWRTRIIQKNTVDMFPSIKNNNEIIPIITEHLALLEEKIKKYFPELNIEKYDWIRNPFSTINTSSYEFTLEEEEEFITLTTDRTLKIKFSEITVEEFWISVQTEFKKISEKAISILLQFSTSYLCELGFSTLTNIKTKKRERLTNIEEEMRVAISYIRPDIENICKNHQAQISHTNCVPRKSCKMLSVPSFEKG